MKRIVLFISLLLVLVPLFAVDLNESFDGSTFPPTGWTNVNGGDTNQWIRSTSNPHSGTGCARIVYSTAAHNDWLITPVQAISNT